MNAEGAGGSGANPPPSNGGASPAQGTSAPTVTIDQVKAMIGETFGELKNGLFAEARRSGLLGGNKEPKTDTKPEGATTQPTGMSAADVQKIVTRERALERSATEHKLTDGQRKRMEQALAADNPDDVSAWSRTYLEDVGIVKAAGAPNATPNQNPNSGAAPTLKPGPNSSDRGSPSRDESLNAQGQVWKMTKADVEQLIATKGIQGAGHEIRSRLKHDLRGVRLVIRRPGG